MPEYQARDQTQQVNLAGDNSGTINVTTTHPGVPPRPVVTNMLRRDVGVFLGRNRELQRIVTAAASPRAASIHTIDGMAGVGKTALAVRAAHELQGAFPDGQYFVDLYAHTPGQVPADPSHVLARLLSDLGVDPHNIPDTLRARSDLWRDRLTGQRVLLVLDDARDHAQIEPLLPAEQGCFTLVTSRRRLVALDGALPLALEVLDPDAAVELFTALSGREPCEDGDRAAVADIVAACGYLPLAIVLLAGRLAHHPAWSITHLSAELAAATDRLAELAGGDRAVRAAFYLSYEDLTPRQRLLFRRAGLHPGLDLDMYAAAALADTPVTVARAELEELYTDHFLEETVPGRYRLHDLLRECARVLAAADAALDNDRAVDRLVGYYQNTAFAAACVGRPGRRKELAAGAAHAMPTFSTFAAALAWTSIEQQNLLACLKYAASRNMLSRVVGLTNALARLLRLQGPWQGAVALHQRAVVAAHTISDVNAEALAVKDQSWAGYLADNHSIAADLLQRVLDHTPDAGDPADLAAALRALSRARYLAGDYSIAAQVLRRVLAIYRDIGSRSQEAALLSDLGWVQHLTGDYATATELLQRALEIHTELGSDRGVAATLSALGWVKYLDGDRSTAVELLQQARMVYRDIGRPSHEAAVISALGWVAYLNGDYQAGREYGEQAHELYSACGNLAGDAFILNNLGWSLGVAGDYAAAIDMLRQALAIYQRIENHSGRASVLNNMGRVHSGKGDYSNAAELIQQALAIYRSRGNRMGEAEALSNMGWLRSLEGDYPEALQLLHQALTTYREIGHRSGETETLNRTGAALIATDECEQAAATYAEALRLARRTESRIEQARALEGSARCRMRFGQPAAALASLREAIELYQRIGAAETGPAQTYLHEIEQYEPK